MPVISDTEESEFDELEYESDSKYKAPKPKGKKVKKAKGSKGQSSDDSSDSFQEEEENELSEEEEEEELNDYESQEEAEEDSINTNAKDGLESTATQSTRQSYSKKGASGLAKFKKNKLIYFDSVNIPKGDKGSIDKFVSTRVTKDGVEEVLTKYKNMSYLSAEWIPVADLEADQKNRQRIRRFLDKPSWETQWSEDEPFNPSYGKIDRIIDDGELEGELHYLVKWGALPYDCSTWEPYTVVEVLDADKIDEFHKNRTLTDERIASYTSKGRNTPIGKWKKLTESPKFKDDNTLRSYQLEGLNWLMFCWHNKQSSILADEMGLGKTVQSTAFLYQLYRTQNIKGPFLVVVPLSTMGNWEREMKNWTDMNVVVYHGNQASRNLLVETEFYFRNNKGDLQPGIFKFDVLLTTYEMAMSGAAQLRPIQWRCVVLDEAHRLKNKNSKITEFLKAYQMEHRVLLTGTPLQNSLDELWALLNFLEPEMFASDRDFQATYGNMSSAADVEKLQLVLKPLMLRRLKEDVEKSIPVKEETIVEVELTTTQKKWYRSILEKNFAWLKQGAGKKSNVPQLVNTMIELRKCCIHPWLLNGAEDQILMELNAGDSMEKHMKALVQSSGKMVLIDKLLTKLKTGGHKVLIFSQMTKCLDLIQEYLRAKAWGYERIDGSVRGEYRQASIDRFSAPDSESFVFLLCTRAGGVGINLTAADTCIIFDSDWNPQNDLQAQSRIHRIGQKKSVKIYRLITRNTYEREMFDRASIKLGLDKALLQRSTDADPFDSKNKSTGSLSKQEVEDLLKKGAYGAFMDDGAGDKFCEEDIDQILERRTMVIRHDEDSESKKGSMFSKASFQAAGSSANVDVNDPDFWDKVAAQAQLEVVDEIPGDDNLILDFARVRKPTKFEFEGNDMDEDPSEDYKLFKPSDSKVWSTTERNRLERAVMQHGFYNFDLMTETLPRRSPEHLQACVRALLLKCIELSVNSDKETIAEVKRALAVFYPGPPHPEGADQSVGPRILEIPDSELPWPEADEKERFEYSSFLTEAPEEYFDHLARKAKNLLIRVALIFNIRHRHNPTPEMTMPRVPGNYPAPWWGADQDRDLLIGVCKHGYQQYPRIWRDSELSFSKIIPQVAEEETGGDNGDKDSDQGDNDEMEVDGADDAVEDNQADNSATTESQKPAALTNILNGSDQPTNQIIPPSSAPVPLGASLIPPPAALDPATFPIPTPTELGLRIRKIINALTRFNMKQQTQVSLVSREKELEMMERKRMMKERIRLEKLDKIKARESDLSKKSKSDFQKAILTFGVERTPDGMGFIWDRFKAIAELRKKSDEALESYLAKLIELSKKTIEYHIKIARMPDGDAHGEPYPVGDDQETVTIDRAKKVIRRIEFFDVLRLQVLHLPDLDKRLQAAVIHGKANMPKWWEYSYDIPFLHGIDRYGFSRSDCFIEDPELPFQRVYQDFLKSLETRKAGNLESATLVDGKFEERFWMRDSVAMKRFELLITLALDPSMEPPKVGRPKIRDDSGNMKSSRTDSSSDPIVSSKVASNSYAPKVPSKLANTRHSDTDDTDEMLAAASSITNHTKKKAKTSKKAIDSAAGVASLIDIDDSAVSSQMDDLKAQYPERFVESGRLPSLASLIPEDGVHPAVFDHHAEPAAQPSPPMYLEDQHHAYHVEGSSASAAYDYRHHHYAETRDEYGRPYYPHYGEARDEYGRPYYPHYEEQAPVAPGSSSYEPAPHQHHHYEGYQPAPAPEVHLPPIATQEEQHAPLPPPSLTAHKRPSSTAETGVVGEEEGTVSKKARSDLEVKKE